MIALLGLLITFTMVFGGYLLAGGKLSIILKSLPFEMMMIGGAAVGAFALSSTKTSFVSTLSDVKHVFKGATWIRSDYTMLMKVLYQLISIAKTNPILLEQHIDDPDSSDLFKQFPKLLNDHHAISIIADTLRSASMNYDDPNKVEEVLEKRISETKHHKEVSVHGLQSIADGLPALGIVAAVLGVIKTMSSIDQPPEVLGKLIGGALVGTFLGVFLAYCVVAPFAMKLKSTMEEDISFYKVIRDVLLAFLQENNSKMCIEVARQSIPSNLRPSFTEMQDHLKQINMNI